MSITSARKFIEKSGCGHIVGVVFVVILVVGLWSAKGCGNEEDGANAAAMKDQSPVLVKVGSSSLTMQKYESLISGALANRGAMAPDQEAGLRCQAMLQALSQVGIDEMIRKYKVTPSESDLKAAAESMVDAEVMGERQRAMAAGDLPATPTAQDINNYFKKKTGLELNPWRESTIAKILSEASKKPAMKEQLAAGVVQDLLKKAIKKNITLSDEDLKKGYDTWVTQRIHFGYDFEALGRGESQSKMETQLLERAKKAHAEIKAGASYDSVMDRYSDDPAEKGKQKHESRVNQDRKTLEYDPSLTSLLELKPGDVSEPLRISTGIAIFKVEKIMPKIPGDFEKNKANYKTAELENRANLNLRNELRSLVSKDSLKWDNKGAQLLYEFAFCKADLSFSNPQKRLAEIERVYNEAKKVIEGGLAEEIEYASVARYSAFHDLELEGSEAQKKLVAADKQAVLDGVINIIFSPTLHLEKAKLLETKGDATNAVAALREAAGTNADYGDNGLENYKSIVALRARLAPKAAAGNKDLQQLDQTIADWKKTAVEMLLSEAESEGNSTTGDYSEAGQQRFSDRAGKLMKLKGAGIVSAADETKFNKSQDAWKAGKAQYDKDMAEQAKRLKEEQEKKAKESGKPVGGPTTDKPGTPTTGPTGKQ